MKRMSALQFYASAICFFSIAVIIIGGGGALYSAVKIASPEIAIGGDDFYAHQNNQSFVQWYPHQYGGKYIPPAVLDVLREKGVLPDVAQNNANLLPDSEEELTALRKESYANLLASERHDARAELVKRLITVLLAAVLFTLHWRMLKKLSMESE